MKNSLMKLTPAVMNCWCNAGPYFRAEAAQLGIYAISCLNPECDNHRVALGRGTVDTAELWNAMMADRAEIAQARELARGRGLPLDRLVHPGPRDRACHRRWVAARRAAGQTNQEGA